MMSFGDGVPVRDSGEGTDTKARPAFGRVLIPVADASQVEQVVELARRARASEARVLHLNLREIAGGRRFTLETGTAASEVVEAAVFELRMAGIASSGQVRHALVGQVAEAIVAEAAEWGADLIVLGHPRRGEFMSRLSGSVTHRVLRHAPCPVLVATSAGEDRLDRVGESVAPVTASGPDAYDDHLSTTPAR